MVAKRKEKVEKQAPRARVVILDTHAILHRAYHAMPEFSSSKGEPTGGLYGLSTLILKLANELHPAYVLAAQDLPKATFRHVAFEAYKGTRGETDDALVRQIIEMPEVLAAFGIPLYSKEGFEADDVIGTLVKRLRAEHPELDVIIATGDMDALQLVEDNRVQVYTLRKGLNDTVLYDETATEEKYGFSPKFLADFKGLRGDPSDNIPGIKGIGEKTATTLIQHFGSVETIFRTIKKDRTLIEAVGIKGATLAKLEAGEEAALLSKQLGTIHCTVPIDYALPDHFWRAGINRAALEAMFAKYEFRSLTPRAEILFSGASSTSVTVDTSDDSKESDDIDYANLSKDDFARAQLAVWVLDSSITEPTIEDIYRLGKSRHFTEAFAGLETEVRTLGLDFVYEKIELRLMPILRQMETHGVLIDRAALAKLSDDYHRELSTLEKQVYEAAGKEFTINSPKQLGEVLFETLGLSVKGQKKTATGAYSTRESELQKMLDVHPIVRLVLAYRELQKLLSTYIDTIPLLLDEHDRLHTTYVQTGTATGRLSSKEPNLQNIPVKTDRGRVIRNAFMAPEGTLLLAIDYSQIELRIAAMLSQDPGLVEIFARGGDAHAEVAARVFHVTPSEVTYEMRRRAKIINFGILYGMGVNALRESLGTSRIEAQEFYNEYFAAFPRLATYLEEVKGFVVEHGYVETMFGRRRYLEGIASPIPYVRAAAERMAVNAPMQGTQADLVKLAMIQCEEAIDAQGWREKVHLVLQVHDELIFEVEKNISEQAAVVLRETMEQVLSDERRAGVPIVANASMGESWGAMKK